MKKKYEKFGSIVLGFYIFLLLIVCFILFIFNQKIKVFKLFNGVVYKDDILVFVLNSDELKIFEKNKKLYIKNENKKFKILEINKNILKRNNKSYNQVYIEINISNKYKSNDVIQVSIMDRSVKSYNIFKVIKESDFNRDNK